MGVTYSLPQVVLAGNDSSALANIPLGGRDGELLTITNNGTSDITLSDTARCVFVGGSVVLASSASVTLRWGLNRWNEFSSTAESAGVGFISAEDYGLSESNTGVQNKAALEEAIAAAQSAGVPLTIGPGTFDIDGSDSYVDDGAIELESIVIRGAGKNLTMLRMTNYDAIQGATMFQQGRGLYDVVFEDIRLQGPPTAQLTTDQQACFGIWSGGGGTLTLNRCRIDQFAICIKCSPEYPSYPGKGTKFYAYDSLIQGRSIGVQAAEGNDRDSELVYLSRCELQGGYDYTLPAGVGGNGNGDCTYVGRGVSFVAVDCRFTKVKGDSDSGGYGFLHYGGTGTARHSACVNCYFKMDEPGARGILSSSTVRTQVIGCTFELADEGNGITPGGDLFISGCIFNGADAAGYGIIDDQNDVAIWCENSYFGLTDNDGMLYGIRRTQGTTKEWRFDRCVFGNVDASGSAVYLNAGTTLFSQCEWKTTVGAYALLMSKGTAILRDCLFSGSKLLRMNNVDGAVVLELYNNRFQGGRPEIAQPTTSTTIRGEGNKFAETGGVGNGFSIATSTDIANLTGELRTGKGVGTYSYAAGVLTLNWNDDTYSINEGGGPTIDTINMAGDVAGGAVATDHNRYNNSIVRLLVKQAFTLGNAGNIVAAAGARAANAIVTLQYFPAEAKWIEV